MHAEQCQNMQDYASSCRTCMPERAKACRIMQCRSAQGGVGGTRLAGQPSHSEQYRAVGPVSYKAVQQAAHEGSPEGSPVDSPVDSPVGSPTLFERQSRTQFTRCYLQGSAPARPLSQRPGGWWAHPAAAPPASPAAGEPGQLFSPLHHLGYPRCCHLQSDGQDHTPHCSLANETPHHSNCPPAAVCIAAA